MVSVDDKCGEDALFSAKRDLLTLSMKACCKFELIKNSHPLDLTLKIEEK